MKNMTRINGKGKFNVGFGEADITPYWGTKLSYGKQELIYESYDTCYVKAMLIVIEDKRVLWLSYDLIGIRKEDADQIKEAISEKLKIPVKMITVATTHGHSYAKNRLDGPVQELMVKKSVEAACQALGDLAGARIGISHFKTPEKWTINRSNIDGAVDRDLYVIRFDDLEGKLRGILFNYPAHPVHHTVFNPWLKGKFGPDWPGYVRRFLESQSDLENLLEEYDFMRYKKYKDEKPAFNESLFTMFYHGTAGDVKANTKELDKGQFDKLIANKVWEMALETETKAEVEFKYYYGETTLPGPRLKNRTLPLQAMWIDDILWMTFPGEIVSELGLLFKEYSKGVHNIMVTTANDYIGYVVTEAMALEAITYESKGDNDPGMGNKLIEDALELAYPERERVNTSGYSGDLVSISGKVINYRGDANLAVSVFNVRRNGFDFVGGFWGKRVPVADDGSFEIENLTTGRKYLFVSELEPGADVQPPKLKSSYTDNIILWNVEVLVEPGLEVVLDCSDPEYQSK